MLNKLLVKTRMIFYILFIVIVFAVISYFSQSTLKQDAKAIQETSQDLKTIIASADVNYIVNKGYTGLLNDLNMDRIRLEDGPKIIRDNIQVLQSTFMKFNNSLSTNDKNSKKVQELFDGQDSLISAFVHLFSFLSNFNGDKIKLAENDFATQSMLFRSNYIVQSMNDIISEKHGSIKTSDNVSISNSKAIQKKTQVTLAIGAFIVVLFGVLLMFSIIKPTKNLTEVIKRLSKGEFDARVDVYGNDEFFQLGTTFNNLLDDRADTINVIDKEHRELNESVINLLEAVANLSEKDMTIRAKVTEDATGPVADALNLLAEETEETLLDVKRIANNVNQVTGKVNTHLMSINKLAIKEQARAIDTSNQMDAMIQRLDSISNTATNTNIMAASATSSTKVAYKTVTDMLTGMTGIRTKVQETGKRIKQLGERSQEISHVIGVIEKISERTTLLALNASMQAMAAGSEGQSFSVIAEEIQRLAESSRESTAQISKSIINIQRETNNTIKTMDQTIELVVDGSVQAKDVAKQMKHVLSTTNELVSAVDEIAITSKDQVTISKEMKHKTLSILKSNQVTGQELLSLTTLSRDMTDYAQQLVASVDVFKLGEEIKNQENNVYLREA